MVIATEHRGYKILWSHNEDKWVCFEAGKGVEGQSLAKVKEAIDRVNLKERKDAALKCFELSTRYNDVKKIDSSIVQYLGPKIERPMWHEREKLPRVVDHKVASVASRGTERPSRQERDLSRFMPDTPEAHAAFDRAVLAAKMVKEAEELSKLANSLIPRVTVDQIERLVEIHKAEKEEKDG